MLRMKQEECQIGTAVYLSGNIVNIKGRFRPIQVQTPTGTIWTEATDLLKQDDVIPKYDPRRPYRKGDIVKARLHGRGFLWAKDGELFTVAEDEYPGRSHIIMEQRCPAMNNNQVSLSYAEIELVQPVEERITYDVHVWDAIRMMRDDQNVMERPFIGADGKPDYCEPVIRMRYVPGSGFQRRMKDPRDRHWESYSLNKNDIEVMWRNPDEEKK